MSIRLNVMLQMMRVSRKLLKPSKTMQAKSMASSMLSLTPTKMIFQVIFLNISRDGYALAQDISSYSLIAVTKYAKPLLAENAGIVTLTYLGSERAVPNYNMMGIAKAALESSVRYLAAELSPQKSGSTPSLQEQSKHWL